jgi:hypothetical protein
VFAAPQQAWCGHYAYDLAPRDAPASGVKAQVRLPRLAVGVITK